MQPSTTTLATDYPDIDEIWPGAIPETDDDLGDVLRNVRVTRLAPTRRAWANSWQTRAFLHLGLRLLYQHQMQGENLTAEIGGVNLWAAVSPEQLVDLAARVIDDPDRADALTVVRWKETWGHRAAYTEDLIAYLFRPGPYLRRIENTAAGFVFAADTTIADFVRESAHAEYLSTTSDPLVGLQTWLQAAMPTHPVISRNVVSLEDAGLALWAAVYEQAFPAFGLRPRDGVSWRDVAELVSTLVEGLLLRARPIGRHPRLEDGSHVLGTGILALISGLFDVPLAELERLTPIAGGSR